VLSSLLEAAERNSHIRQRIMLFEVGPIFFATQAERPDELHRLAILITGPRFLRSWLDQSNEVMDFFDLKGIITRLLNELHIDFRVEPAEHATFHPGKTARIMVGEQQVGVFGELHPQVQENYDFSPNPVVAADFDLDLLITLIPERYDMQPVPEYPPVLEDLAFVVDENISADRLVNLMKQAAGKLLADITLFDVYRSDQIGKDKKSLAYSLTYQSAEKTLTDNDVAQVRQRIIRRLEQELGAKLRA
jgi:phenylalanyl-tRNA synthetase beta chain